MSFFTLRRVTSAAALTSSLALSLLPAMALAQTSQLVRLQPVKQQILLNPALLENLTMETVQNTQEPTQQTTFVPIVVTQQVFSPVSTQAETQAVPEGNPVIESDQSFKNLPAVIKAMIRKSLENGVMPPKEELAKIPPLLREKVIQEINKIIKERGGNKSGIENIFSEYWVQMLALLVSLVGVFLAVSGFTLANAKKKKSISKFFNEIDDTFSSFKSKSKRCEAELYRLQDLVEDQLKEGKIDESIYHLLEGRIQKYLNEIHELDNPVQQNQPVPPQKDPGVEPSTPPKQE